MDKVDDPRDIIIQPIVSEKSYGLIDEFNKYTFLVKKTANKTQIKIAVEQIFGVKVTGVNTINRQGKRKRTPQTKRNQTQRYGKRPDTKRAIVSLAGDDRIDIFGQVG
ncbi:50S ribosomal protein L23 [Spongiactinospora rosea]|uniref:Large ribosomal subunit protein uL23 n=2 Tax=Spongiactinospora TaxID=2871671 RepID=A0A2W2HYL8_9ACTN|nr:MULTISPECIES: 50S ribosomal protein L23 [Spongiactinospora]PZG51037.1 50S ribosomal protein L23 [Spongiactinospora gelatinilytica]RBQ22071.1 50S ribosomal protein L23 [Spongiactinospora rosea]